MNFVKNEISERLSLSKLWFSICEFLDKTWIFAPTWVLLKLSKIREKLMTFSNQENGIWTFWQGLILVISSVKWSPFLSMRGLKSCGTLAARQNITRALEGCDIKSAKIFSVIFWQKFFFLLCRKYNLKTNKTQSSKLNSRNLSRN